MRRYVEDTGLPFNILVDETREVTRQYGVWHRLGLDAWNISRPALFVIEGTGVIRAIFVGERQEEFPGPEEIEGFLDKDEGRGTKDEGAARATTTMVTKDGTKTTTTS